MRTYTEYLTIQTNQVREVRPITEEVKKALAKSEFHDGMIVVGSLHLNAAVILGLNEPSFFEDLEGWLGRLAPVRDDYRLSRKFESNSGTALQTLLLHPQVTVPSTEGRPDRGPWQEILYAEFDGHRPKRVVSKVMGD